MWFGVSVSRLEVWRGKNNLTRRTPVSWHECFIIIIIIVIIIIIYYLRRQHRIKTL